MSDEANVTDNVTLWNEDGDKSVTVTTDGSKERLDVSSSLDLSGTDKDRISLVNADAYKVSMDYILNNGQTKYQSIQTPDTATRVYLRWSGHADFDAQFALFEAPTGVVYNFGWTERNRNRDIDTAAEVVVRDVTSVTSAGTFLTKELQLRPQHRMRSEEWILKQDTEYLISMQNLRNGTNRTLLEVDWYEL